MSTCRVTLLAGRRILQTLSTSLTAKRTFCVTSKTMLADDLSRKSHYMKLRDYNLHYEKVGRGDHVVLLIPGALGSTVTDLDPQLALLNREKFTLIGLDPPGYGKSRPPPRKWPEKFLQHDADVAAEFMQVLGHKKYSVAGWSDGGNVAMILAACHPSVVRKMVVWGSNSYLTKEELEMYESVADIDKWSERMRKGFIDMYGDEYFRKHWALWVEAERNYYHKYNGNLFKELLPEIQCETLIIHGDKDVMVPVFQPEFLKAHIKNSSLIRWPDAKHNLHLRYPDEFNAEVEKFLDD